MDPLLPIDPSATALPSRRVPPVDRLRRITREGDRPRRDPKEQGESAEYREPPEDEPGEGHIDIRV
jgi:hypothetical protein